MEAKQHSDGRWWRHVPHGIRREQGGGPTAGTGSTNQAEDRDEVLSSIQTETSCFTGWPSTQLPSSTTSGSASPGRPSPRSPTATKQPGSPPMSLWSGLSRRHRRPDEDRLPGTWAGCVWFPQTCHALHTIQIVPAGPLCPWFHSIFFSSTLAFIHCWDSRVSWNRIDSSICLHGRNDDGVSEHVASGKPLTRPLSRFPLVCRFLFPHLEGAELPKHMGIPETRRATSRRHPEVSSFSVLVDLDAHNDRGSLSSGKLTGSKSSIYIQLFNYKSGVPETATSSL